MDVLNEARAKIAEAISELDREKARLESALASLSGGTTTKTGKRRGRPPGRRSAAPSTAARTGKRRGRKRGRKGGTRADHAVKLVEDQPGISASEIAKKLKIKPNYLYRVLGDLEKEGRVRKEGRAYHPASAA
ncbi:MAG: winged helix-turn-helix transcriptional regulator [Solirubrobacterales bacterium]